MKTLLYLFSILFFTIAGIPCIHAQTDSDKKIKVYLLGTFHFAQTDESYNVLEENHQKSIQDLCNIIARHQPDKVFVERQPEYESQNKLNELFTKYHLSKTLKVKNELYQVGFRVAKMLDHPQVYQCDHPGMYGYHLKKAVKYAKKNKQLGLLDGEGKGAVIRYDEQVNEDSIMQSSTLLEYLHWINSEPVLSSSHASYITNYPLVGSYNFYDYEEDNSLIGAELTADWYRRNIMIYTKMISQLDYEEDAIFLLMGGDHIPIIRYLFETNPHFEVVPVTEWLTLEK